MTVPNEHRQEAASLEVALADILLTIDAAAQDGAGAPRSVSRALHLIAGMLKAHAEVLVSHAAAIDLNAGSIDQVRRVAHWGADGPARRFHKIGPEWYEELPGGHLVAPRVEDLDDLLTKGLDGDRWSPLDAAEREAVVDRLAEFPGSGEMP